MNEKALIKSINEFTKAVDAEKWTEFVREYAEIGDSKLYGGKHGGSDAEHEGARFIRTKLEEIGVPKVEIVETPASRYQFNDATLLIDGLEEIKPYGYRSAGTDAEGISAEIIDVGTATRDEFDTIIKEKPVNGKIVMFEGMGTLEAFNLSAQIDEAASRRAAAILIYMTEDILNEDTIRVQTPLNVLDIPVVGISIRHAEAIKEKLNASEGSVIGNLIVDAQFTPDQGETYNVVGEIPGTESDEIILFTAHLDHFFRCLQDNMASCAALLGIAEAVMKSGYKPKRSMVFAFHGSHECGISNSKYPYITGSYELMQSKLKEWRHRIIADINFEYAALPLEEIKAVSTIGADRNLLDYIKYSPERTGGYRCKGTDEIPLDSYSMFSWVDAVSYCTEGIPAYTNDVLTEQLEGLSPYIGRDHSNHDDWDSFSTDALRDSINYYGGFGMYLDFLPYVRIDFSRQADRLYAESSFDELEKEGMKTGGYRKKLDALAEAGKKLAEIIDHKNDSETGHAKAAEMNRDLLELNDWFQKKLDRIAASDFIITASGKSLYNASLLYDAAAALETCDVETAKEKLFEVDLASTSYFFSESIVDHMRDQVCGEAFASRRTWARGRELSGMTLYDLMTSIKRKEESNDADFRAEIKNINKTADKEAKAFLKQLKEEMKVITEGTERIKELCQKHLQ